MATRNCPISSSSETKDNQSSATPAKRPQQTCEPSFRAACARCTGILTAWTPLLQSRLF